MAQNYASSVQGVAIRVTSLNADGTTATGASASYVLNSFIRVSFTPEYEEGDEFTEKNAAGGVCTTFKADDTLKRANLEVAVCNPDAEFTQKVAGGLLLSGDGLTQGYAAPEIGVSANPNGVALEVWSKAVVGGKIAAVRPYFRFLFPYVQLRPSGERVIENGIMAHTFEGWSVGNSGYGDGPQNDWTYTSDRAWAYTRAASAPLGINGFQTPLA